MASIQVFLENHPGLSAIRWRTVQSLINRHVHPRPTGDALFRRMAEMQTVVPGPNGVSGTGQTLDSSVTGSGGYMFRS